MNEPTYSNPWIYKGRPVTSDDIGDAFGFVYKITDTVENKFYLGRKYLWSFRKPKGKSRRVKAESNWKEYYSSSEVVKAIAKERPETLLREILSIHSTKGETNYNETKALFLHNVLESNSWYNDNILGRYYRKNIKASVDLDNAC